jgi:prolyl-tRNA synthetase
MSTNVDPEATTAAVAAVDAVAAPVTEAATGAATESAKQPRAPKEPKVKQPKKPAAEKVAPASGQTKGGITASKATDFAKWYSQLVVKAELIEYYPDISGCYILRPWAYAIWETVQAFIDGEIKKLGVKNTMFPMFVAKRQLEAEKSHIEGFQDECAWVTHAGKTKLEEPIAIRPTSETIMYPIFAKWINSHRDLPLKVNQWCNVVRWEFKYPTPFIRTREFLWQEGHTAYAKKEDAEAEVLEILDIYHRAYKDVLACSTVKGRKTDFEKFAGGDYTTTIEGFIPSNGRAVQAATSHHLGQNFARMCDIKYLDDAGAHQHVFQNSWGFTTRSLGVMIMTHSDDKGLVLPPVAAPIQAVLIPIYFKDREPLKVKGAELTSILNAAGVRTEFDSAEHHNPGWKYTHWEIKGVPLRIEFGPKDMEKEQCVVVRRDTGEKSFVAWTDLATTIPALLATVQREMYERAHATHMGSIKRVTEWDAFMKVLAERCLAVVPHCGTEACEKSVKTQSAVDSAKLAAAEPADEESAVAGLEPLTGAAKSLCIPFEQPEEPASNHKCIKCGADVEKWVMFGRSY